VTIDRVWTGNRIYWTLNQFITMLYELHRLVFSITVFITLLGSSFQGCNILGIHVQWFLPSLAGTFQLQLLSWTNWLPTAKLTHKSKICYDWQSVSLPWSNPHLELKIRFLLLWNSFGFLGVAYPLWREDRSVTYNCCWPSPVQSFSGPSPTELMTIFYCLRFESNIHK
jgi:hypothetical protein